MRVCVVGLGYMGLPTACLLAENGVIVNGVDICEERLEMLGRGIAPFQEPGLPELLRKARDRGVLSFSKTPQSSDAYIICVPTPVSGGALDLKFVEAALGSITPVLKLGQLVVVESTVGPGSGEELYSKIRSTVGFDFLFSIVPEKAIPGNTLCEIVQNERIIGGRDSESLSKTRELYSTFVRGSIFCTDMVTAATCKLIENTYRDVNIAFANLILRASENLGIDPFKVIDFANLHPRVNILKPGIGVGGHCIPVDPWFLIEKIDSPKFLIEARAINDNMPSFWMNRILQGIEGSSIKVKTVGLLGMSYKEDVADIRNSPSVELAKLIQTKFDLIVNDPGVLEVDGFQFCDLPTLLEKSDYLVVALPHSEYRNLPLEKPHTICFSKDRLRSEN